MKGILLALLLVIAPMAAAMPPFVLQWPDDVEDIFVAETSASELHRYYRNADGSLQRESIYLSIGENGIRKQREWDRRTPIGVYLVTDQLDTRRLHEKYGVTAFPLDYPNARDRQLGRTGDGIWLHGVLPGGERRPPLDTDGCLAIPNEDLSRIAPLVRPGSTPVVVAERLDLDTGVYSPDTREALHGRLLQWVDALGSGDLAALRGLYSAEFSYEALGPEAWTLLAIDQLDAEESAGVDLSRLLLVADPGDPGVVVSRFPLGIKKGPAERTLFKRLYWREEQGTWRIIAEDSY